LLFSIFAEYHLFFYISDKTQSTLFFSKLSCNVWQVLTKPLSVDLPAAVLNLRVRLFGNFHVAYGFGGVKQASYLWQR